jgi:hypothetical protein
MAELGKWREAADLLGVAAKLAGSRDPKLLADLSQAQLKAGDVDGALASAREAYRVQRARPEAAAALAAALGAKGEGGAEALLAKVDRMGGQTALAAR